MASQSEKIACRCGVFAIAVFGAFSKGVWRSRVRGSDARICPVEGTAGAQSSSGASPVTVVFRNSAPATVFLFWVDGQGEERAHGAIAESQSVSMNSFSGHLWRAREDSGRLLLERRLGPEAGAAVEVAECTDSVPAGADDAEWLHEHGRDQLVSEGCTLSALLSALPLRGFHVACAVGAPGKLEGLCIFTDGRDRPTCTHRVPLAGDETVDGAIGAIAARVRRRRPWPRAPAPALFTASGRRLPGALRLLAVGVPTRRRALVLADGGEWHWPPVAVGFERPLRGFVRSGAGDIVLRTLSLRPRIFEVKSFIADAECDQILEKAGPHVQKSSVVVKDRDHGKPVDDWRTSENYFLQSTGDSILEGLDEKVQNLTRIAITHSEMAQVLKYVIKGRYTAHTDYFDPKDYQSDAHTLDMTADGTHNRLLTVFMYMSDVEKGGETTFPRSGGLPQPASFEDCTSGLQVPPERRKVIIFYNMHPNGDTDPESMHGGCRVVEGTKWSANFWFWNVERSYKSGRAHVEMAGKLRTWNEQVDQAEEKEVAALAASLAAAGVKREL